MEHNNDPSGKTGALSAEKSHAKTTPTAPITGGELEAITAQSGYVDAFIRNAHLGPFDPCNIPTVEKPHRVNNDLELDSFRPTKYLSAGEQRNGIFCHTLNTNDPRDHTIKAVGLEFS